MSERLTEDLLALLGEDAFVALADTFGGQRLFIPRSVPSEHPIALAIGNAAATRLSRRYSQDTIRVPMARKIRVAYYLGKLSHAKIAKKLGIGETGVDYIVRKQRAERDQLKLDL